jgi:hypothetical protein
MKEEKSNEINLLDLIQLFFKWLGNCLKTLLLALGYFVKLLYRHYIILGIVLIVFISGGLYMSREKANRYKVEAMATLNGCDAQSTKEVSRQLEQSFTKNKLISFGTKLNLQDSVSINVKEFHSYYVIDYKKDSIPDVVDFDGTHSLKDTVNVRQPDRLYFRFITKNVAQVPQVQQAVLSYLNSNPTLQAQFQAKRNALLENLNVCNVQIQRIDSMSKTNYFKEGSNQVYLDDRGLVLGGKLGKQLYYRDLETIEKIKAKIQLKLASCNQPVELPSGFIINSEPVNDRKTYLIWSFVIGMVISALLGLILENRDCIKNYLKK